MSTSGSIRTLSLDGYSVDVINDADFSGILSNFEKETIATSGSPIIKRTKRVREVEGVKIKVPGAEAQIITDLDERIDDFPINYTEADGTVWRTRGQIAADSRSTMDQTAEIKIIPVDKWEIFTP